MTQGKAANNSQAKRQDNIHIRRSARHREGNTHNEGKENKLQDAIDKGNGGEGVCEQ